MLDFTSHLSLAYTKLRMSKEFRFPWVFMKNPYINSWLRSKQNTNRQLMATKYILVFSIICTYFIHKSMYDISAGLYCKCTLEYLYFIYIITCTETDFKGTPFCYNSISRVTFALTWRRIESFPPTHTLYHNIKCLSEFPI